MLPILVAVHAILTPAQAPACGPSATVARNLAVGWSEELVREELDEATGDARLLYANEDTGSWTFVVRSPDGVSCVILTGHGYKPRPAGEGA